MSESGRDRRGPMTPRPRFVSIRTRLALTLATILAVITILLCSLIFWQQALEHRVYLSARLQQSARGFQARLEAIRIATQVAARSLAAVPTVQDALSTPTAQETREHHLLPFLLQQAGAHEITEIALFDRNGRFVTSTLRPLAHNLALSPVAGLDLKEAQTLLRPTGDEERPGVEAVALAPVHLSSGFGGTVVAIYRLTNETCDAFKESSGDDVSLVTKTDKPTPHMVRAVTSLRSTQGLRLQGMPVDASVEVEGGASSPVVDVPDLPMVATYAPLISKTRTPFWIEVASPATWPAIQSQTFLTVLLGGLLFLLAGTGVGLVLARRLTGPLIALRRAADGMAEGHLQPIPMAGNNHDEVGALAQAFDKMLSRLQERDQQLLAKQLEQEQVQKVLEYINQELQKEKRELEILLDSIREGVVVLDTGGTIVKSNSALCAMVGMTERQVLGRNLTHVLPLVDARGQAVADLETLLEPHDAAPRAEGILPLQAFIARDDSTRLPVEVDSAPIEDMARKYYGQVVTVQDVSRRFEMDRLKDEFLAFFTHDLKSPISAIVGYAQLLAESDLTEEDHAMVENLVSLGKLLALEISNILSSTRVHAGRMSYHSENFTVSTPLHDLVLLFSPVAQMQDITFQVEGMTNGGAPPTGHDDVGSLVVYADLEKVQDVLNNLVGNALKFTPSGGTIRVSVKAHPTMVDIVVSDTGKGIPADSLPHLFDKFYQVTGKGHGSGLGLYIAHTMVEGMGGKINVQSAMREGSTFTVSLPRGTAEDTSGGDSPPSELPARILVVDANRHQNNLLRLYLERQGIEHVHSVFAADEARQVAEREPLDLLVIAEDLGDRSGWALARDFRAQVRTREIPIVFVTARRKADTEGLVRVQLLQPVQPAAVLDSIHTILRREARSTRMPGSSSERGRQDASPPGT